MYSSYGPLNINRVNLDKSHKWTPEYKRQVIYCLQRMADRLDVALHGETGLTEDARELINRAEGRD